MKRRTLKDEIGQREDFTSPEAEMYLNLLRTAEALSVAPNAVLRSAELSHSQYNVLRILRGATGPGLSCREIIDRMVTRDSDMTRLLDGLEKKRLIARHRSQRDRRVIVVEIIEAGLALLAELDTPILDTHIAQLGHMSEDKLKRLSRLLEEARHSPLP